MSQLYGYSPRILPFKRDSRTGFSQNTTLQQVAVQNFINLVLCAPGERIMYPTFGVGLRNYLFEMNLPSTRRKIRSSIMGQTAKYLPYIKIKEISFKGSDEDRNLLKIDITFYISSTDEVAGMSFVLDTGKGSYQIIEYGGGDEGAAWAAAGGMDLLDAEGFAEARTKEEAQFDDDEYPGGPEAEELAKRRDVRRKKKAAGVAPHIGTDQEAL